MSVLAAHRAAIVALMASVPDMGLVHDEEQYAATQARFADLYLVDVGNGVRQLRGWFVRRTGTQEREINLGRTLNVHSWDLHGFTALDSAASSGKAFDERIEALRQAWRLDPTLGGAVEPGPLGDRTGVQVAEVLPVMFAGVLCHKARLQVQTYAYLNNGE